MGLGVEALSPDGCEAPSYFDDFFDFTTCACWETPEGACVWGYVWVVELGSAAGGSLQ